MAYDLIINEELKNLLPSLSAEEFAGLEESILKDGCLSALTTWNDTVVDGHHRYEICKKNRLSFEFKRIEFDSLDDAKLWILKHQANRRNLTPYHRVELTLKLKPIIADKAKKNCSLGGGNQINKGAKAGLEIFPNPVDTRKELATIAGVSDRTHGKADFIAEHADDETKEKLRRGDKGTSIDKEYNRLKKKEKIAVASDVKKGTESEDGGTHPLPPGSNRNTAGLPREAEIATESCGQQGENPAVTGGLLVPVASSINLPHAHPEVLVYHLMAGFPREYTRQCPLLILEALCAKDGLETIQPLVQAIIEKFGNQ